MRVEGVTIIGAGPAGMAAALQLKRYGIHALLLEQAEVGGLLRNANLVENYPGFPRGIPGLELVKLFEEQAKFASVQVAFDKARLLTHDGKTFRVDTLNQVYYSQVVVVATGTQPRTFTDFPVPANLQDSVFYEVYPLLGVVGKQIAIIGAGDAAFDYALNLAQKNTILILNRSDQVKCLPLLWERAASTPHITYYSRIAISGLAEAPEGGITLACKGPAGTIHFHVDNLIGALGRDPCVDFISPELFETSPALEQQGVLYWIGDVRNGIYRQTAIAVGDGIRAAMHIYRHFEENMP